MMGVYSRSHFPTPLADAEAIHIVHLVKGRLTVQHTVVLFKSLLYFQGRFQNEHPSCDVHHVYITNRERLNNSIHIHFIADKKLWSLIHYKLMSQARHGVSFSFYDLDPYLVSVANRLVE